MCEVPFFAIIINIMELLCCLIASDLINISLYVTLGALEQVHKNCIVLCIVVHNRLDKKIKAIMQNIATI